MHVITSDKSEWIDAEINPPKSGDRVQALTIGGVQVSAIWTKESKKYFVAWASHLKVPQSVKIKLQRMGDK